MVQHPLRLLEACALALITLSAQAAPPRIVVRDVTLLLLNSDAPTAMKPHMTLIIERGVITEIRASTPDDLAQGDVPVDIRDGFVVAGLIESAPGPDASYDACARRTVRGVTTLFGTWTEAERRWLRRISETSVFALPDVQPAPTSLNADEAPRVPSTPRTDAGERARRLRALTSEAAERAGLPDRGRIEVGQRADLLILAKNPLEDFDAIYAPTQMLLAGRPARIAELAANRSMQERASDAIEGFGPPTDGRRSYAIESGGLRVGRLDIKPGGTTGLERWGPPIDQRTTWQIDGPTESWGLALEEVRSSGPVFSIRVRRQGGGLLATVRTNEEGAQPTETVIPSPADGPLLDPIALAIAHRSQMAQLTTGKELRLDLSEIAWPNGSLVLGIRTLVITAVAPAECPMPAPSDARTFLIADQNGGVKGWLATDVHGEPIRAALVAPEGVTEYLAGSKQSPPKPPIAKDEPQPSPSNLP